MNSPPSYEWEQLFDIDDSDLPLTPVLRPCNSHVHETSTNTTTQNPAGIFQVKEKSVRIIPSPAGIVQVAKLHKQSDIYEGGDEYVLSTQEYIRKVVDDVGEDEDFKGGSWVSAVEFINANGGGVLNGCLGDIENYLKNGKLEQVVSIIKSCTPNALGDLTVTLEDLSGHALILGSVLVFSPKPSLHYLNITMRNVVKIFCKDIIAGSDSGVCGNVIEQEDLYKFDKESLNLALEEEARQARAEHDWLEKCRQEEELGEEHEIQLCRFYDTF
ncbi:ribonuclease H-like domain-containing protein [Tanacetum coccineum]